jgi:TolA-binding protein
VTPAPPPPVAAPPVEPVVPPATLAIDDADRAFSAANYAKAISRYEDYLKLAPTGNQRDKALFQVGVILALPEYAQHDWDRAVSRLKQLVSEHPQSPFKSAAQIILGLRGEITQLGTDKEKQDQRIRQLTSELDRLKRIDAERLRKP